VKTLFNAGTRHPQLSSCYLTTIADDLGHIFKCIRDSALLSKWAGGLGNDWTNVRGLGAAIRGTYGKSQGVIPFLKVANDTAVELWRKMLTRLFETGHPWTCWKDSANVRCTHSLSMPPVPESPSRSSRRLVNRSLRACC
jgi:ribonucleotide reductase alpha subunit